MKKKERKTSNQDLAEIILESVRRDMARCAKKKTARYKTWGTAIQIAIKTMRVRGSA